MLKGWSAVCRNLGIREYYNIPQWGGADPDYRGARIEYLKRSIPRFHRLGAVTMNAEACSNWGASGPRLYLAARLLWDVEEDADAVMEDFYRKAFGRGAPAMRRYYERWERGERLSARTLALSLLDVAEAQRLADTTETRRRVDAMALYLHYVKLHADYAEAAGAEEKERIAEGGDDFLWRFKNTFLVHTKAGWGVHREGFPFFTREEVASLVADDVRGLPPREELDVAVRRYSWDLVPLADAAGAPDAARPRAPAAPRGRNLAVLFRGAGGERIPLVGKNISYRLSMREGDRFRLLARARRAGRAAAIELPEDGLYKLNVSGDTRPSLPADRRAVMLASHEAGPAVAGGLPGAALFLRASRREELRRPVLGAGGAQEPSHGEAAGRHRGACAGLRPAPH
jgi:hypothetical protein